MSSDSSTGPPVVGPEERQAIDCLVELYREQRHAHLVALGGVERFLKNAGVLQFTTAEIRQQWRQMRGEKL